LYPWGANNRRCYLHLYYNARKRADAVDQFNEKLVNCKKELESGKLIAEHQEVYDEFFVVKTTAKRGMKVSYNTEAVSQYISRYAGFQAILTNSIKDPVKALQIYRDKDIVEKCFDDLKNQLDMKRLRMHSSAAVDGRLFIQFIALIYISAIRKEMRNSVLIERYTVRELMEEMETLTKVKYSGKYGCILTEVTKPQREILKNLAIELPKT
jgi:transposase